MTAHPQTCQNASCRRPRLMAERYCRPCLMSIEGPPPEHRPGFIPPEERR